MVEDRGSQIPEGRSSDMKIIIKDSKTGKEFMIVGHKLDYEIFQRSKGKKVGGVIKGEGNWVSCRNYPSTLPAAVYKCINWILADPDDDEDVIFTEAEEACDKLRKILSKRVSQIVAEVCDD